MFILSINVTHISDKMSEHDQMNTVCPVVTYAGANCYTPHHDFNMFIPDFLDYTSPYC